MTNEHRGHHRTNHRHKHDTRRSSNQMRDLQTNRTQANKKTRKKVRPHNQPTSSKHHEPLLPDGRTEDVQHRRMNKMNETHQIRILQETIDNLVEKNNISKEEVCEAINKSIIKVINEGE